MPWFSYVRFLATSKQLSARRKQELAADHPHLVIYCVASFSPGRRVARPITRRVVKYNNDISRITIWSRWQPNARERLERAAVELFLEQGFAETTVPQITARAGLTTRTFFRHFADKREVLFAVEEEIPGLVARLVAEAPASFWPDEVDRVRTRDCGGDQVRRPAREPKDTPYHHSGRRGPS